MHGMSGKNYMKDNQDCNNMKKKTYAKAKKVIDAQYEQYINAVLK